MGNSPKPYQFIVSGESKPPPLSAIDKMLIDASKRGDLRKLMDLYHNGAQLLATDQYGMTCLHHAARFGHKDIVRYLIDNGECTLLSNVLTLKTPRKTASENVVCLCHLLNILADFSNLLFAYRQTVWTLIRLLKEQSDLGPHCLQE